MDVQCERCKTEYEFDDVLVSGRGTTVRCTHCGYQFNVSGAGAPDPTADRWIVQTTGGQQLTFLTLPELQRAILAKQVSRADALVTVGASPRPLGSISELEPFFDRRASWSSPSLPPPTVPVLHPLSRGGDGSSEPPTRLLIDDVYRTPTRRRVGGWVVAFVLMVAVGVVGWVVAKPYLRARDASEGVRLDERARGFLDHGEAALLNGDLESCQEDFDKASALAANDSRTLLDLARVAAARADISWLALRLVPGNAIEEMRTVKAQLGERVSRARGTAAAALAVASDDPAAIRAMIDALRLVGQSELARTYIPKVSALASQPETAYVLAALDLSEPEPMWRTVIDRLRLASAAEGNAGRSRAALVYALAQSGDPSGARAELAKLDALARPYPILPNLHAFCERVRVPSPVDGGVPGADLRREPSAPRSAAPRSAAPRSGANAGDSPAGDVPSAQGGAMQMASRSLKKGDIERARKIYEGLVSRNPGDSEALAGIGDCDRAQGDLAGAIAAYKRAISVNPSYLPALLGAADAHWAANEQSSARAGYADIVERFPEGTYPRYVKDRTEPSSGAPAATAGATASPKPSDGDGI